MAEREQLRAKEFFEVQVSQVSSTFFMTVTITARAGQSSWTSPRARLEASSWSSAEVEAMQRAAALVRALYGATSHG